MRITLCREKTSGITVHVWAETIGDSLVISGQDSGNECIKQWGKEKLEYTYQFDIRNTLRLYEALCKGVDNESLLGLMVKEFYGIHGCEKLRKFCELKDIQYSYSSW